MQMACLISHLLMFLLLLYISKDFEEQKLGIYLRIRSCGQPLELPGLGLKAGDRNGVVFILIYSSSKSLTHTLSLSLASPRPGH